MHGEFAISGSVPRTRPLPTWRDSPARCQFRKAIWPFFPLCVGPHVRLSNEHEWESDGLGLGRVHWYAQPAPQPGFCLALGSRAASLAILPVDAEFRQRSERLQLGSR